MNLFILELGMGPQPFQADFAKHGRWVTDLWLKSLWKKASLFGLLIEEGKIEIVPPHERDEWIMLLFCKLDYDQAEVSSAGSIPSVLLKQG
jgi:hypothetical protein